MARTTTTSGTHWEEEFGYARAVRVGERVFVSGTTATGEDGVVGVGDSAAQARFIFNRIERALIRLGSCLEDVVRTRVYVTPAGDWRSVARVHGEVFRAVQPANTMVRAELIGEESLVEIEADAVVGAGPADTAVGAGPADTAVGAGPADAVVGAGPADAVVGAGPADAAVGVSKP